ncbi:MAG: cell division protein FtsQ/DivIB [Paracoccaceae bacterium]
MRPLKGERRIAARAAEPRRDPAPSRMTYRLNRLWLTPSFRRFLRVGLPAGMVLAAALAYFGDEGRRQDIADWYADIRRQVQERPEFMVGMLAVEGASPELSRELRAALPIRFPISSFHLDLEGMRKTAEGLDAVARADLRIRPGGVLELAVTERIPALVWRGRDALELVDATGHRVAALEDRTTRADLPLIAGEGATDRVDEALALFHAARPIADRLRGIVRVGERRWDLVLDPDQRILLPERDPVAALQRVVALHQAQDLLSRDIVVIDMRNATRPTLRLAPGAAENLRRMRGMLTGANEG